MDHDLGFSPEEESHLSCLICLFAKFLRELLAHYYRSSGSVFPYPTVLDLFWGVLRYFIET